jgi:hypothetical protein
LDACQQAAECPDAVFKRFVYLSSSHAARTRKSNTEMHITSSSWNEEAIAAVEAFQKETDATSNDGTIYTGRGITVYAAAKALAEKEVFRYLKEEKPTFTINTLVSNFNLGGVVHPHQVQHPGTPVSIIQRLFQGLLAGDASVLDTLIAPRTLRYAHICTEV